MAATLSQNQRHIPTQPRNLGIPINDVLHQHRKETPKEGVESYHVSIHHIKQAKRIIHGMGIVHQKKAPSPSASHPMHIISQINLKHNVPPTNLFPTLRHQAVLERRHLHPHLPFPPRDRSVRRAFAAVDLYFISPCSNFEMLADHSHDHKSSPSTPAPLPSRPPQPPTPHGS
jgi:hypothetical protein